MPILRVSRWGRHKVIVLPKRQGIDAMFEVGELVLVEKGEFVPASRLVKK